MLKCKKITALLTALCMAFMLLSGVTADEEAVKVVLSDSSITVDGETILTAEFTSFAFCDTITQ